MGTQDRMTAASLATILLTSSIGFFPTLARAEPPAGGVEIWIRAFIPNPANAGKSGQYIVALPGQPAQSLVRLLPTDKLPDRLTPACYMTDNRGFSSAGSTTSRLETRFVVEPVQGGGARVTPSSGRTTAAVTTEVTCSTGAKVASAAGKVNRDTIGAPAVAAGMIQVIGQATGTNQLALSGYAPSIDYSFDVRWAPSTGRLTMAVSYGSFPAIEVYARSRTGGWKPVLRHLPTGSPWNLAGDGLGINFERDEQTVDLPPG